MVASPALARLGEGQGDPSGHAKQPFTLCEETEPSEEVTHARSHSRSFCRSSEGTQMAKKGRSPNGLGTRTVGGGCPWGETELQPQRAPSVLRSHPPVCHQARHKRCLDSVP